MKDSGQYCLCHDGYVTKGHCGICGHIWDAPRVKSSAERTLNSLGYTDNGGELWKPPLGQAPEYIMATGDKDALKAGAEWDGFPPVGTTCLFHDMSVGNDDRLTDGCEISILSEIDRNGQVGRVFTTTIGQDFILDYSCLEGTFKPLKTKADELLEDLTEVLSDSYAHVTGVVKDSSYFAHYAEALVKAGYCKHVPMGRDFSAGAAYQSANSVRACIDCPGWPNVIECYAGTKEGAELLRDEILERIC